MPKRKTQRVKIDEPLNKKLLNENETAAAEVITVNEENRDELPTINEELLKSTKEIDENNEKGDIFIEAPLQY